MAVSFQVNGEASIWVDPTASGTPSLLGITIDGVRGRFIPRNEDVMTDTFGGESGIPAEVQQFLAWAEIECDLVKFDAAVLASVVALSMGGGTTLGTMGAAGALLRQQNYMYRTTILAPYGGIGPLNFPQAYIQDAQEFNLGTKRTAYRVVFRALPDKRDEGSTVGAILFNGSTTGISGPP
jgi:hypothetical protein